MNSLILTPPVAFLIILATVLLLVYFLSRISCKAKANEEASKAYACGEDVTSNMIQPDYSVFFPFAFLFTILHVAALVVATVQVNTAGSLTMAFIYVAGAITALFILFRR